MTEKGYPQHFHNIYHETKLMVSANIFRIGAPMGNLVSVSDTKSNKVIQDIPAGNLIPAKAFAAY